MDEKTRQYYRDLYEKLRQQYTLEELAESFVFPSDLTEEEKRKGGQKILGVSQTAPFKPLRS